MSQLQPRRSLKPVVNPKLWNRKPITVADAMEGELIQMHEQALQERDELLIEKKEMDRKLHELETKNMSDQHKMEELQRQLKDSEESNDQLRSQVTDLKEQVATHLVDKASDAHQAYSDEEDSYNFIVDAYDRRSSQDVSISSQNEKEFEMAAQAAVALIAKESAIHRREVYHLRLLAQNQETLIHKLEKKLIDTLEATNQRARASNLMLLEGMEKTLLQDSMQAKYELQQLEISKNEKVQDNQNLNIYTSVPSPATNLYTPNRKDSSSTTSHRTSVSSAMLRRKRPSIPPVTPPPREPLPPLPFRESYTSSSARTSSSSVMSFSVSSPTTYSSSEWEKSGSSGHQYQTDLDKITIQGEGDEFSKAARGRSGFWKGIRSKMVQKH